MLGVHAEQNPAYTCQERLFVTTRATRPGRYDIKLLKFGDGFVTVNRVREIVCIGYA